jgi:BNR repeat-containing family member
VIVFCVSAAARVAIVPARARAARSTTPAPAVTTLGEGSWCWFGDPRAVELGGVTYVGWISWQGAITIAEYRPDSGLVASKVVGNAYHDDHSSPSILIEPDGRLTVFYSSHNGSQLYERTSTTPAEITSWGPRQAVPVGLSGKLGFTYPNPLLLSAEGNSLYLFWRGVDWSADYATRTPAGRWSTARRLLVVKGERPYLKADVRDGNQIGLAFTNGHPRNVLTSIYYAEIHHGSLWHANGRWITRLSSGPISASQADVVYNAQKTKVPAWVWDVAFTTIGHPVIAYATFPKPSEHLYWYARWTGSGWVSHLLTHGGGSISPNGTEYEYSGGVALDHQDPSNLYLSRQVPGGWQIERWSTHDGGAHWTRQLVVPVGGADNVRPVVARGPTTELFWLHGDYNTYRTYRTSVEGLTLGSPSISSTP